MDANQIAVTILGVVFIGAMFIPAISHRIAEKKKKSVG